MSQIVATTGTSRFRFPGRATFGRMAAMANVLDVLRAMMTNTPIASAFRLDTINQYTVARFQTRRLTQPELLSAIELELKHAVDLSATARLVLDLRHVHSVSMQLLNVLDALQHRVSRRKGSLTLVRPGECVQQLLAMVGRTDGFNTSASLTSIVGHYQQPAGYSEEWLG